MKDDSKLSRFFTDLMVVLLSILAVLLPVAAVAAVIRLIGYLLGM